jgi:hypothetical protein
MPQLLVFVQFLYIYLVEDNMEAFGQISTGSLTREVLQSQTVDRPISVINVENFAVMTCPYILELIPVTSFAWRQKSS